MNNAPSLAAATIRIKFALCVTVMGLMLWWGPAPESSPLPTTVDTESEASRQNSAKMFVLNG